MTKSMKNFPGDKDLRHTEKLHPYSSVNQVPLCDQIRGMTNESSGKCEMHMLRRDCVYAQSRQSMCIF